MRKIKINLCVHRIRIERELSQTEMAKICNVSQTCISEIELNQKSPTFRVWAKISNGMQVDPLELLEFEEIRINI